MRFLSPAPFRPFFLLVGLFSVIQCASQPVLAQSAPHTRKAPPPPPPPPATDQEQFLSYWTTETGWRTELQLRNNQPTQSLSVTPVLRTADGMETSLSPVMVNPREVKSIDLDTAITTSRPAAYRNLRVRRSPLPLRGFFQSLRLRNDSWGRSLHCIPYRRYG